VENSTAQNDLTIKQTNILPRKDRYKTIWFGRDDWESILALSIQRRKPMVQVAHDLLASYFICQKQGHAKEIGRLERERGILGAELTLYIDYFGELPESARPKKNEGAILRRL
jgi:hypothetical protein